MIMAGGTLNIERNVRKQITQETEDYPMTAFTTEPCKIRMEKGATINMGNYESAKVSITIEMPCMEGEISQKAHEISNQIDSLLDTEIKGITGDKSGNVIPPSGEGASIFNLEM